MAGPSLPVALLSVLVINLGVRGAGGCLVQTWDPDHSTRLQDLPDSVNILELDLTVVGYSQSFWDSVSVNTWYKPTRLYRCRSRTTERFLLLFYYYFGLFKPFSFVGLENWRVNVTTEPEGCLYGKSMPDIHKVFNNFILNDLKASNGTADVSDSAYSVCATQIIDRSGWAFYGYKCCVPSSGRTGSTICNEVTEDSWSWVLRSVIIIATAVVFMYFPIFIPRNRRREVFSYNPRDSDTIRVITTRSRPCAQFNAPTIPFKMCKRMKVFGKLLAEIPMNTVYKFQAKRLDFRIKLDRIIADEEPPFNVIRSLYDNIIRCKISNIRSLEDCCISGVCGRCSCSFCPRWIVVVKILRTLCIFVLLALPSLPLSYYMCSHGSEFREMYGMVEARGLLQTNSFSFPTGAGVAIVCVLAALYLSHAIVVVAVRDTNLGKLYGELLSSNRAKMDLKIVKRKAESFIKNTVLPLKLLGILFLPLWIIFIVISPVIIFLYFIGTSPVMRIALRVGRLLFGTFESSVKGREEMQHRFQNLSFCVTIFPVFAVLTVGFNFLLHVLSMAIIIMIVNITFSMRILPVALLFLFYIRDTFATVVTTYHMFSKTILSLVLTEKMDECRQVASLSLQQQCNVIFQCGDREAASARTQGKDPSQMNDSTLDLEDGLFSVADNQLLMNTSGLTLFLHKDDIPYISRKFFDLTTELNFHGCPGPVSASVKAALATFVRIIVFLLCLLTVVMAYGDVSYISPEGQFFATFVTGLIPFAMKKFFLSAGSGGSVDTSNLRFSTQFEDLEASFQESWPVDDVIPAIEEDLSKPKLEIAQTTASSTSTWNMEAMLSKKTDKTEHVDLIVDMSDFDYATYTRELEEEAQSTCKTFSCLKPISVSP